jgi:hypothetical protein
VVQRNAPHYSREMPNDRSWLLRHLNDQATYLASLTAWAAENPTDAGVLLRVRDEVFTLRETLDALAVPHVKVDNETWAAMPHAPHDPRWPTAADAS